MSLADENAPFNFEEVLRQLILISGIGSNLWDFPHALSTDFMNGTVFHYETYAFLVFYL